VKQLVLSALLLIAGLTPAAAEWSGSPYSGRQEHHIAGRTSDGADIQLRGRDVEIAPQGACWLVNSAGSGAALPPGARAEFIPFRSPRSFDSYRENNVRGRQAQQCAFNMPVTLCGASVGQTGHRALGTAVGPFTYDTGDEVVTLTLRAERQGSGRDYGWSVASQSGSCDSSGPGCSDPDYAEAHSAECVAPDPRNCDDPDYRATHSAECGAIDPYCPAGYTARVVLGLTPTYYDASGAGSYNPNTVVGCASSSALATPTSCPASDHQSFQSIRTDAAPYGFPAIWFCGYYGALDESDYNDQWGDFPTLCANDFGSGAACGAAR
jgi:hypothetical protein